MKPKQNNMLIIKFASNLLYAIKNVVDCTKVNQLDQKKTLEGKIRSAQANLKHKLYTKQSITEKLYYQEMLAWKDDTIIF